MKDKDYDIIYAGLVSGRVDAAIKVIQFAEALLVSMLDNEMVQVQMKWEDQ